MSSKVRRARRRLRFSQPNVVLVLNENPAGRRGFLYSKTFLSNFKCGTQPRYLSYSIPISAHSGVRLTLLRVTRFGELRTLSRLHRSKAVSLGNYVT